MRRRFNVTGSCNPKRHYMVKLDDRLKRIKESFVDDGSYFVINRGRQYGKTTTLRALADYLKEDYVVLSLDFQTIAEENFADNVTFVAAFLKKLLLKFEIMETEETEGLRKMLSDFKNNHPDAGMDDLFVCLSRMCKTCSRPIVLMIDEVDSASNNQVFIDFLAQLRGYYLNREEMPIFHSVILAGVYDIKNLKLKLRPDSEHQYNSPWNIAAKFDIDMDFSVPQIMGMLEEYERDHHTGMNMQAVAEGIRAYTSGYPVLVSMICKQIDEEILGTDGFEDAGKAWTKQGIEKAVHMILEESPLLFESLTKQLDMYDELYKVVEDILYCGKEIPFSLAEKSIHLGHMFGYLKKEKGHVAIANRMFEMYLLNMFMAKEAIHSDVYTRGGIDRIGFIKDGKLDMALVLKKFAEYFTEVYGQRDQAFLEKQGRKIFLIYLKPIINGTGNYYMEAQTRDERRTDIIVDYRGEQFIIELKIWHGNEYNERGEAQLADYLDCYRKDKGYMLSFNFNKNKQIGVKEIKTGDKTIIEAVV